MVGELEAGREEVVRKLQEVKVKNFKLQRINTYDREEHGVKQRVGRPLL